MDDTAGFFSRGSCVTSAVRGRNLKKRHGICVKLKVGKPANLLAAIAQTKTATSFRVA